ncbi:hypothetical protein KZ483_07215 [Paenibacillus sp. sptzw28]|uniref:hypothetical protein n=1 Tax=Paenibacillus sp. sptzw28 TaxID=715179 RepID=UPI001C6EF38B|nr:hypothetical protein [Paenibacillus sp. sptzw28]QYR22728.1 hypothetical protein KZ483_07215 [Paenibacillus sp. sptzw28]
MRQLTKKKVKKWGIGAGCTLSAVMLFSQIQNAQAQALATLNTDNEASSVSPSPVVSNRDPVISEFKQYVPSAAAPQKETQQAHRAENKDSNPIPVKPPAKQQAAKQKTPQQGHISAHRTRVRTRHS